MGSLLQDAFAVSGIENAAMVAIVAAIVTRLFKRNIYPSRGRIIDMRLQNRNRFSSD
jgi:hypothetical protein